MCSPKCTPARNVKRLRVDAPPPLRLSEVVDTIGGRSDVWLRQTQGGGSRGAAAPAEGNVFGGGATNLALRGTQRRPLTKDVALRGIIHAQGHVFGYLSPRKATFVAKAQTELSELVVISGGESVDKLRQTQQEEQGATRGGWLARWPEARGHHW